MKILVLEDEPGVMTVLRKILQRKGYTMSEPTTAEEALRLCGAPDTRFDLLIAAVNLHVSSGIEVALQLKAWMPYLKVILISGFSVGAFNERHAALYNGLPSDSVRFLQKPYTPTDLLRTMESFRGLTDQEK